MLRSNTKTTIQQLKIAHFEINLPNLQELTKNNNKTK